MAKCKYETSNGRCGLKGSYAYRYKCFTTDLCKCHEPMTNADRIRAMSDGELAEWICDMAYGRKTPWSDPFEKKFCDNCPTVHCTYENGKEDDFHECDFVDGECPHGSDIVWWLKQPAEEVDDERGVL